MMAPRAPRHILSDRATGTRQDLGVSLWRLADFVAADERRRSFRAKAYQRAMWALDDLSADLSDAPEAMLMVPGIGVGVLRLIQELQSHGRLEALVRLEALYPEEVAKMRTLPRMTPALLRMLKAELGVERASDLLAAIDNGAAESLRGIGPTTAARWSAVLDLAPSTESMPAYRATVLADDLAHHLRRHLRGEVWPAGEVRRVEEWVHIIDLVAGVEDLRAARTFLEESAVARFIGQRDRDIVELRAHGGARLAIHLVPPRKLGARLLEITGPPDRVGQLLRRVSNESLTEVEIYERSNQDWVPPPARGLSTRRAGKVIRLDHLRGDLHLHTSSSPDGRMSLFETLIEAEGRGYEYVLITDHTSGLRFGGLDGDGLLRQAQEIDEIRPHFPGLVIFHGAELNIGRDGSLDVDDEVLGHLDLAVAGVHSNFDLDRVEQTARVVAAMERPAVRVLAHPTGRRIGRRPAIDLDIDAVVSTAVDHQVALEVNGHLDRLDLSAPLAARAVGAGALLAADSDSHRAGEMGNIAHAVATMQRAGVGPDSVVNTFPVTLFKDWVDRVRPTA